MNEAENVTSTWLKASKEKRQRRTDRYNSTKNHSGSGSSWEQAQGSRLPSKIHRPQAALALLLGSLIRNLLLN